MARRPIRTPTLQRVLRTLGNLNPAARQYIRAHVGENAFKTDFEVLNDAEANIGLSMDDLRIVMSVLTFLYDEMSMAGFREQEALVVEFLRNVGCEDVQNESSPVAEILRDLLDRTEVADTFLAANINSEGHLPSPTDFDIKVDLRPNLSLTADKVHDLIPIFQCRLVAQGDPGMGQTSYVFQTDLTGLSMMREAIELAEAKLSLIRSQLSSNTTIRS